MTKTKDRIIEAALDLFSESGYEKISVQQIAEAVGIKAPSLYKHYSSKQEIFDEVIRFTDELYEKKSALAFSNKEKRLKEYEALSKISVDEMAERICDHLIFVTTNPAIVKARKLLSIEHFRHPELCGFEEKHQFTDILDYSIGLVSFFIEKGLLVDKDVNTMALQLVSPIILQIQRIDRNQDNIPDALNLTKNHIRLFFEIYGKDRINA